MQNKDMHALWFALLVVISLATYGLYSDTQRELRQTQEQIAEIVGESEETIEGQKETIAQKEEELDQAKESEVVLQEALDKLRSSGGGSTNTAASASIINEFAPSVVRLVCLKNSTTQSLKQGSGVLFSGNAVSGVGPYYVQTNLHVVQSDDGSESQCVIAIYPDTSNPDNYIVYKSEGYILYKEGIDLAYLEPLIITNQRAGTVGQLASYAQPDTATKVCSSVGIGDQISVLGYPGIGGDSLTVTDGIVSGFEFRNGTRYIKTSAKIDQGNSGGIAIKDTGCMVGIPTFVQAQIESLGRVLDLRSVLGN